MRQRPVVGSCELCARRFDLLIPDPSSGELDFRRIEALFRHCASCGRYVGRACCWNPTTVMCIRCGAKPSLFEPAPAADLVAPRRVLRDLSAALTGLSELEERIGWSTNGDLDPALNAWEDAWLATGMLMTRVDSDRDAVAKQLREPSPASRTGVREVDAELRRLLVAYEGQSRSVARRLAATGQELSHHPAAREATGRSTTAERRRTRVGVTVVVVALLVLGAGVATAALDRLGRSAPNETSAPGGVGRDGQGAAPSASGPMNPTVGAAWPRVESGLAFDLLTVGPIQADPALVAVEGSPEVAAFPSPFDRSLRLSGTEPEGVCLAAAGLRPAPASVALDLYIPDPVTSGLLRVSFAPVAAQPAALELALAELGGLRPERWYRLDVSWDGEQSAVLEAREPDEERAILSGRLSRLTDRAPSVREAFCLGASGMAPESSLLIDNVKVEQAEE